jgi:hypothetical protein
MNLTRASEADPRIVVYDWLTRAEFLIWSVLPHAEKISASPADGAEDVMARVPPDASAFLFHQNCTLTNRFPNDRDALVRALTERGIPLWNDTVTDISKRSLQDRCGRLGLMTTRASKSGSPADTLIVKTNLNYGGASEWALNADEREALAVGNGTTLMYEPNHYRVLPRSALSPEWWHDDNLVIERYIENDEGSWYRAYLFLTQMFLCRYNSPFKIKKVGDSSVLASWSIVLPLTENQAHLTSEAFGVAKAATTIATDMRLDFGALDIMVDDESNAFVIDVNSTPAYNYPEPGLVQHLRGALTTVAGLR